MTPDQSPEGPDEERSPRDAQVDEEGDESFPASDPPSSWAGESADEE